MYVSLNITPSDLPPNLVDDKFINAPLKSSSCTCDCPSVTSNKTTVFLQYVIRLCTLNLLKMALKVIYIFAEF